MPVICSIYTEILNMFVDYQKELPKENLPVFIKNYCLSKHTETTLKELWNQYLIDSSIIKKDGNQYLSSVVITEGIFDLFKEKPTPKKKELNQFIQSDFVLSDDTNCILEYNLKKRMIRYAVIDNIISLLLEPQTHSKMNISVETQLIYNICRAIDCTDIK